MIPEKENPAPEKESPAPDSVAPEGNNSETNTPVPPPVHREFEVEEEWAETLHMHFDPAQAKGPAPDDMPSSDGPMSQQPPVAPPPYTNEVYGAPQTPPPAPVNGNPEPIAPLRPPMPPTYLFWSILATLCCCLPAGIVAIIYSANVSSKYYAADYEGAKRTSRQAEIWIIVSIVAGIIVNALYVPLTLLMPV